MRRWRGAWFWGTFWFRGPRTGQVCISWKPPGDPDAAVQTPLCAGRRPRCRRSHMRLPQGLTWGLFLQERAPLRPSATLGLWPLFDPAPTLTPRGSPKLSTHQSRPQRPLTCLPSPGLSSQPLLQSSQRAGSPVGCPGSSPPPPIRFPPLWRQESAPQGPKVYRDKRREAGPRVRAH